VIADHYAGAGTRWAQGAALVYGPIATELVALSPHPLAGHTVLDVGAGTGVATPALHAAGARPVALDRSWDMLAWDAASRPPSAVADVRALPLPASSVDDAVASFVLNHLADPEVALTELRRVTRPGGALLATVYANASRSAVRDRIDAVAADEGWQPPEWYRHVKTVAAPLLGTAADMAAAVRAAGLVEVRATERAVDVGVTEAGELVTYRLGQAHFAAWLDDLGPERAAAVQRRATDEIRPIMEPYRPIVVFVAARVPPPS
jgi:SAM-dependent methyltransferase